MAWPTDDSNLPTPGDPVSERTLYTAVKSVLDAARTWALSLGGRGSANGYTPLNSSARVDPGYLGSGTPTGAKTLFGDGTWGTPSGGTGGHVIQDEGTARTARAAINFVGAGVVATDDPSNDRTNVTIPGGGAGGSEAVVVTVAAAGTAQQFDVSAADVFDVTLNAASCSLSVTNVPTVSAFTVVLHQDGIGGRAVTWAASFAVKWPADTPPTLNTGAAKASVLTFVTLNGGLSWYPTTLQTNLGPVGTAPSAPVMGTAVSSPGGATATWTVPTNGGGTPITNYTLTPIKGGVAQTPIAVGTVLTYAVSGYAQGDVLTFTVTATNGTGTSSASSAANAITVGFSPLNGPGVFFGFDAPSLGLANLASVTALTDLSGGVGNVPSAGSAHPSYRTNQQNGLAGVRFANAVGSSPTQFMKLIYPAGAGIPKATPITMFAVLKLTVDGGDKALDGGGAYEMALRSAGTSKLSMFAVSNVLTRTEDYGAAAHIYELVFAGASSSFSVDGNQITGTLPATSMSGLTVGERNMDLFALYCYQGTLTTTDRSNIRAALQSRFGTP